MTPTHEKLPVRKLGNSDLELTAIGFGAWAIGGDWTYGWGSQSDDESIATIRRALDLGINWIDTAAIYGLGRSEEVVARALKGWQGPKPLIFSKCGMRWDRDRKPFFSLKKDSIREEIEASLRRLQVERIDLYQMHWPRPDEEIEEGWTELQKLKQEGKIRYAGVSNFSVGQMERARKIAPITSLQPPYSLVKPAAQNEVLPYCQKHNIGVINYSPMASGLLTGKFSKEHVAQLEEGDWRKKAPEFNGKKLEHNLEIAAECERIGKHHHRSPGEVAIAWTLANPAVTAAIVGARRPSQLDGIIGAATFRLRNDEVEKLNKLAAEKVA